MNISKALDTGIQHHEAGRLAEAEAAYRGVLARQPDHADALHLLGLIAMRGGWPGVAAELIRKAITSRPAASFHNNLGNALVAQGFATEAVGEYRKAVALAPGYAEAHCNLGAALKLNGRPDEALAAYRSALEAKPESPLTHFNLGNLLKEQGRMDEAAASYRTAISLKPDYAQAHINLGNTLKEHGRIDEAIEAYRSAAQFDSVSMGAYYNLGNLLREAGRIEEAMAAYRGAVALNPDNAAGWNNLGNALRDCGRPEEAATAYQRALALKPDDAEMHDNLGIVFAEHGQFDEAAAEFREAIRLRPGRAEAYLSLGKALKDKGSLDEAISACRKAIELKPGCAQAWSTLGSALAGQGRTDDAIAACRRATEAKPGSADAWSNLGHALAMGSGTAPAVEGAGPADEAGDAFRRALELEQRNAATRLSYSVLLLSRGDFEQGWPLYEARWETKQFEPIRRTFSVPLWDGSPLNGERLLIHAEQGFGDSIQFVRYASLIKERGGVAVVHCPRDLAELFGSAQGVSDVVAAGDPLPAFDLHVPMLSQPLAFKTTVETIPSEIPYLFADPARCETWRARLGEDRVRLRVGLGWAGNPAHRGHRFRSVPLEHLAPLFETPGVDFYSLQMGRGAEEIQALPAARAMLDYTKHFESFADTAAMLMQLDLVVSVDTAVLHLAGALGRPAWALLSHAPDWRWLRDRADSPWYPTVRLFRQARAGDWGSVVGEIREQLKLLPRSL